MTEQAPLTFNQVNQQLTAGSATILVERTDGSISTAQFTEPAVDRTNVYLGDFANTSKDDLDYKSVNNEQLSDQHQEKLAAELAGVALREADVKVEYVEKPKPVEKLETPFDAEKANLQRAIADAMAAKRQAQKDGDGQNSIYWGQIAGQYQRELNSLK